MTRRDSPASGLRSGPPALRRSGLRPRAPSVQFNVALQFSNLLFVGLLAHSLTRRSTLASKLPLPAGLLYVRHCGRFNSIGVAVYYVRGPCPSGIRYVTRRHTRTRVLLSACSPAGRWALALPISGRPSQYPRRTRSGRPTQFKVYLKKARAVPCLPPPSSSSSFALHCALALLPRSPT